MLNICLYMMGVLHTSWYMYISAKKESKLVCVPVESSSIQNCNNKPTLIALHSREFIGLLPKVFGANMGKIFISLLYK